VEYYIASDEDTLLAVFDDNEDEFDEFKMAFTTLSLKCEELLDCIGGYEDDVKNIFDDCTVSLLGNRYKMVGFDDYEEDYFSLSKYEGELAETESGKRLMRLTKKEMIATIGQCMGILIAFYDLRAEYNKLETVMNILRDENYGMLQTVKAVEESYKKAAKAKFDSNEKDVWDFDKLTERLPQRIWVE
ncbi:MAG: hypothetical protein LUD19_03005, partial [Clostridia bacterium]|nr:hypothetical protein [Clostridia bacterium]